MDADALARIADTMADIAERQTPVSMSTYQGLRTRLFEILEEDRDLDVVMPVQPEKGVDGGPFDGANKLGVVATYLRSLMLSGSPRRGRVTAASDLMEQADDLLLDRDVTPIAPIVIAAAALEELLRDLVDMGNLQVSGRPGLTSYAQALRSADALSTEDVKEITSLAGVRNQAAHGELDKLSAERAGVFVDRVNLLLRQLQQRD